MPQHGTGSPGTGSPGTGSPGTGSPGVDSSGLLSQASAQAQQAVQSAQSQVQPMPDASVPQPQPAGAQPGQSAGPAEEAMSIPDQNTGAEMSVPDQSVPSGEVPGVDIDGMLEEATPSEQKEYERAMGALYKVMYEEDTTSNALVEQLSPDEKIGSVAKASMLLLTQLDDKLDFDDAIIAQMTEEVVDRVIELGEANFGEEMAFSDRESQAALGATWEGVMEIFGVDEQDNEQLTAGMNKDQKSSFQKHYKEALNG